jgi:sodium/proline symporter
MPSSQAVWTVIGASAAVLLVIALWTMRRARTLDGFHLADRELGAIRGGLSGVASAYSFWAMVGVTGAAFTLGWSAIWLALGILLGAAFSWFVVGPALRRRANAANAGTALELAGAGSATVSVTSIAAVAVLFGIVAQLGFAGGAVARGLGLSTAAGVMLVAALALVGPVLGGLRATASAGVLCALVVIPAAVLLPQFGLIFVGGFDQLRSGLATTGEGAAALLGGRGALDATVLLLAAAGLGASTCGQPQVLDQYLAARSERSIRWSGVIAVLWLVVVLAGALALGWVARIDYASIDNPDVVMFEVPRRIMAPSFVALPILAVLALVVCSVGNQLVTTCYALLAVARNRDAPPVSLGRLRVTILLAGVAAAVIAAVSGVDSSRGFLLAWLATSATVGPLVLLACAGVRVRNGWAAAAARVAIALALVLFLLRRERLIEIAMFLPFYAAMLVALLGRQRQS